MSALNSNHLFSLFHLNLAFSSIAVSERPKVMERCYRPLIDLARSTACPITVEASGWTLETMAAISPELIDDLKSLIDDGLCEFVGSGYVQAIGPLMPHTANQANQRLGIETYEALLGTRPNLVLVNEQAFTPGLIPIYRDAGYKGMILDWANVFSAHPGWDKSWGNFPQMAIDQHGAELPIIWCNAIAFQKFQRYAHGETDLGEFTEYVAQQMDGLDGGYLAIYGSDAEIFDYRPGRYGTEAVISGTSEWERIGTLWREMAANGNHVMSTPSKALEACDSPVAWKPLSLISAAAPVLVKKQPKYNIMRWAVTGRDDLALNTACWRIYQGLVSSDASSDEDWRELLWLWSSDYRTHIEEKRWQKIEAKLAAMPSAVSVMPKEPAASARPVHVTIDEDERSLRISAERHALTLNLRRGGAIQAMAPSAQSPSWIGTVPHGFFDHIAWSADFYSGHLTCEIPGQAKVTDLGHVTPKVDNPNGAGPVSIEMEIATPLGAISKTLLVHKDRPRIEVAYRLAWDEPILGSLRMAHVTLNPNLFSDTELFFRSHNGGSEPDVFELGGTDVDHGAPISTFITCGNGLGMTDGTLEIGDATRKIRLECDRTDAAMIGLITYKRLDPYKFMRASLSAREHDDTSRKRTGPPLPVRPMTYRYAIELVGDGW